MRQHIQSGNKLKYFSQIGYFPSGNPCLYCKPPPATKAVEMPDAKKNDPAFLKARRERLLSLLQNRSVLVQLELGSRVI